MFCSHSAAQFPELERHVCVCVFVFAEKGAPWMDGNVLLAKFRFSRTRYMREEREAKKEFFFFFFQKEKVADENETIEE